MIYLYNAIFYTLFIIYSAVFIPMFTVIIVVYSIFAGKRKGMALFRKTIILYGRGIIYILARYFVRVTYKDLSGDKKGPFIYIANHNSSSDPFLMAVLWGEIVQVVNTWPFKLPVLGFFARNAGYLNVRSMPFTLFLKKCQNFIRQGVSLIGFPEGTRSVTGDMGPFHGAMFRVALETGVKVSPLCILGNLDKPPKGSLLIHPGTIEVHRLPSINSEEYQHMGPYKFKTHVRQLMKDYIQKQQGNSS